MPIKVWIEPRENCIADMVCVSLCPDVFEMSDVDGKSIIIAKWRPDPDRKDQGDRSEGVVPDDYQDCVDAAAQSCPTQIIHYEGPKGSH
ncbi:MAG: ferredoxin [Acidilobus sp.]